MITLCAHCLKPLDKLIGVILPSDDKSGLARVIHLDVQKLHAVVFPGRKPEIILDVVTAECTPRDIAAITVYVCPHCREALCLQVHAYDFSDAPLPGMGPDQFGDVLAAVIGCVKKPGRRAVKKAILRLSEPKPVSICACCGKPNGAD